MLILFVLGLSAFLFVVGRLAFETTEHDPEPVAPMWTAADLDIPDTVPAGWVDAYGRGKDE